MENSGTQHDQQPATAGYASLLKQRRELDARLADARAAAIEQFKQKVMAEAEELELDLASLFAPERKSRRSERISGEVRYRDPSNPANTWSGRGRPPKWLQDHLDAGRDKDEFVAGEVG